MRNESKDVVRIRRDGLSFWFALVAWAGLWVGPLAAQGPPETLWQTNAHLGAVNTVAISPDNSLVASASDDWAVQVRRASDGTLVHRLTNHTAPVLDVAFSPDGQYLASCGYDITWRLWRVADGGEQLAHFAQSGASALAYSPDGTMLATAEAGYQEAIGLYQMPAGIPIRRMAFSLDYARSVAFSPDGSELAANFGGIILFFRVPDGTPRGGISLGAVKPPYSPDGRAVALLSYGPSLAYPYPRGPILLVAVADGLVAQVLSGHSLIPWHTVFSPTGRVLISTSLDETIRLWRIATGKTIRLYDEETAGARPIVIAPNSRFFAYGRLDGTIVVARMPVVIGYVAYEDGRVILEWEGGTGLYQLQQSRDLGCGAWQNLGEPTSATSATNKVQGRAFYRIQSLPNGP